MQHLILEATFETPFTAAEEEAAARKIDSCLERYGARWVRSYVSLDRRRTICEFEAPDAEAVRVAYRSAGAAFERVWPAEVYAREDAEPAPQHE
jgi:Protein of unknown function (DUF4242)